MMDDAVSERQTEPSPTTLVAAVAANIRSLRVDAGLSIGALARRAGIAKSTLSQLELGRGNPSVETLWALAVALDAPFGRLVAPQAHEVRVVRAGDGTRIESEGTPFGVRLLASSDRRSARDLYALEAEPGPARVAAPHRPGTTEHAVLLGGRLRLGPEGQEVELGPGDYATFPGDVPHRYEALEPRTRALLILEYA
jgi:transcriptional regulator with XRE-family HTH domain